MLEEERRSAVGVSDTTLNLLFSGSWRGGSGTGSVFRLQSLIFAARLLDDDTDAVATFSALFPGSDDVALFSMPLLFVRSFAEPDPMMSSRSRGFRLHGFVEPEYESIGLVELLGVEAGLRFTGIELVAGIFICSPGFEVSFSTAPCDSPASAVEAGSLEGVDCQPLALTSGWRAAYEVRPSDVVAVISLSADTGPLPTSTAESIAASGTS